MKILVAGLLAISSCALVSACGNSAPNVSSTRGQASSTQGPQLAAETYRICPGENAQKDALKAFFSATQGDSIEFCAGRFEFTTGLVMTGKRGVTIRGAGPDKTILSFAKSPAQDGLSLNQVNGITVQDITILDAPGNGLRIFRTEDVIVRRVHVGWSNADPKSPNYDASTNSWDANGAYAFYPVMCDRLLIEDSVAFGSSDSGFYVGQSRNALVRRNIAYHNVIGFEFENTYYSEFAENESHDNISGISIFDLPGRIYTGAFNSAHHNKIHHNNLRNFGPRGSVAALNPSGTGMLIFAADLVRVYDNEIHDNNSIGIAVFNYGILGPGEPATHFDWYPEGVHIYNNVLRDNAQKPALPRPDLANCAGHPNLPSGAPGPSDDPACVIDNPSLIPLLIVAKNSGKGAQILWDGARDQPNDCQQPPLDRYGVPLTQPNPAEHDRGMPRTDFRGRPNFYHYDPRPVCKWTSWKFDDKGSLKLPQNGVCIKGNRYESTSPLGLRVDNFANLHVSSSELTPTALLPPTTYEAPEDCPPVPEEQMASFNPVPPRSVEVSGDGQRLPEAEVAALCDGVKSGEVNQAAIDRVNCPELSGYGLFANPENPLDHPNGQAIGYALNTALFSDYALKDRFIFLPKGPNGQPQKLSYQDSQHCEGLAQTSCETATLKFPVGTVIAKTFSFKKGSQTEVIETRLLIKRAQPDGRVYWVGLPYRWRTDAQGQRHADLKIEGDSVSVAWDYTDEHGKKFTGSTERYTVPNAGACLLCHGGDNLEAGAAPIGPKVRNLNRDNRYDDIGTVNQLSYLKLKGLLDLPDDPTKLERLPRWDVPGDTGELPDTSADKHKRVLAYLEVNCMHCHNEGGNAANSGLRLNAFNEMLSQSNGICKVPIAAGKAAEFGRYDIQPGFAANSILPNRVATTQLGAMMPPLGRSVPHGAAAALLNYWVDNIVSDYADARANICDRNGGGGLSPAFPLPTERK